MPPQRKTGPAGAGGARKGEILAGDFGSGAIDNPLSLHESARRDHALLALIELSQALVHADDLYQTADTLLLNLMGQVGTARAAVWICHAPTEPLVLVRSRGFGGAGCRELDEAAATALLLRFMKDAQPILVSDLRPGEDHDVLGWTRETNVALLAPISLRGETLGLVALGPRAGKRSYDHLDRQVVQSSLAIAAVAVKNCHHASGLLEKNRQLRVANDHLQHLDQLQAEFLGNVNHELRTPLAVIMASLECLDGVMDEAAQGAQLVRNAHLQSKRLQTLIENLLTFARASEEDLPLEITSTGVATLLADYHRERLPGIAAELREFLLECPLDLPPVHYDARVLRRVLDALVDNAVKFTPRGARIRLRATREELPDSAGVRIDVIDNGLGIPADRLPSLFGQFRQLDGSMTREVGGLGLGLALSQRLVSAMEGRLTAQSDYGKGATFSVHLRAA